MLPPKNILYINHYAGSREHGMEYRPYFLSRRWVKQGNSVFIIAASFAHTRKIQPEVKNDFSKTEIENIDYYFLKTPHYHGNGIMRFVNILVFVLKLFLNAKKIARTFSPNLVIASSTYPLDVLPAYFIAKYSSAKLVYEVPDLWPLTLIEVGGFSRYHPFVLMLQFAENFAYKHCDFVVSCLPFSESHMRQHGLAEGKFIYIPNGLNKEDWQHQKPLLASLKDAIEIQKSEGKFLLGYAGYHGLANSLRTICEAAGELPDDKYHFFFVGSGPEKTRIQEFCKREGINNITFFESIDKASVPEFLHLMDCNVIAFSDLPIYRFGVSTNKTFDYMMSARPIVQALTNSNDYVGDSGCGKTVPAETPSLFAKAILEIAGLTPLEREVMGNKGKQYVLEYNEYEILATRYLQSVLGNK